MSSIFDLFKKLEESRNSSNASSRSGGPAEYMIVGLGNPGRDYEDTRHNAGFMAMDVLCKELGCTCNTSKFKALTGKATVGGKGVLLMKPQTYMNNSGEAVRDGAAFYKIPPENIIVIYDDINFEPGSLRIREKGSDGGHNGIKSIIYQLASDSFPRIRLGVGKKPRPDYDLVAWVMGTLKGEDAERFSESLSQVPQICRMIIEGDIQKAMGSYNKKK